ncbi:hypothetical protein [Roseimaritima multifibrata]|nr:hypothetical protein [Roseimaritima multifibrata]
MSLTTIDSPAALRRAAILLTTLDDSITRRLLLGMPPLNRARLRRAMVDLTDVDPMERSHAMREFLQGVQSLQSTAASPASSAPTGPSSAGTYPPTGGRPSGTPSESPAETPLSFLETVPDPVLLRAIEEEHPQTIAIVLASLQPKQAARLLPRMSETTRNAAMHRLAKLDQFPPDALDSIGEHLKQLVANASPYAGDATGSRCLSAILDQVPGDVRQGLAAVVGWENRPVASPDLGVVDDFHAGASLSPEPRPLRVAAETVAEPEESLPIDMAWLDSQLQRKAPVELRDALSRLDGQEALLAVCGLPGRVADQVLGTLPRKQARLIRQQLKSFGSVTLKEIDTAKTHLGEQLGIAMQSPQVRNPRQPVDRPLAAAA